MKNESTSPKGKWLNDINKRKLERLINMKRCSTCKLKSEIPFHAHELKKIVLMPRMGEWALLKQNGQLSSKYTDALNIPTQQAYLKEFLIA